MPDQRPDPDRKSPSGRSLRITLLAETLIQGSSTAGDILTKSKLRLVVQIFQRASDGVNPIDGPRKGPVASFKLTQHLGTAPSQNHRRVSEQFFQVLGQEGALGGYIKDGKGTNVRCQ